MNGPVVVQALQNAASDQGLYCLLTEIPMQNTVKVKKIHQKFLNKSTACGCQRSAAAAFRNSKSEKGHNYVKEILRVTCLTGMGFPSDSKQLV